MGKPANKARGNRYKKDSGQRRLRLVRTLLIGFGLGGLLIALLVLSAGFVAAYAAVTRCDYLRAQSIEISGLARLSRDDVLEQAGLHVGDNLLAVNLRLVHGRLLAHPWIAAAQVTRTVPGTIGIVLREHRPLAVVALDRRYLINDEGRIFKEADPQDPTGLPVVTGIGYADISLDGDDLTWSFKIVRQVLNLCQAEKSVLPYDSIEGIHLDAALGIILTQRQGQRRFKLGIEDFESKLEQLRSLLHYLENHGQRQVFRLIDISNPDRIVVQLDTSTSEGDL